MICANRRHPSPPIHAFRCTRPKGIVCTGLFDDLTETPDDYRATLLLAKTTGLPMLCANPDIVVDLGDKRLYCAGALAQAYDQMGGKALYFGKPHPPIYDLARRRLAELPRASDDPQILCIGDGIATDIQGGDGRGARYALHHRRPRRGRVRPGCRQPRCRACWTPGSSGRQMSPTYAIGRLR